ncbi:glycosyltransferase [Pedobacter frigidisoli]|uniref:glycosyltransferase n=1 Tax=Pedobacter frigidisoli TaxID=2530455 RepID=UPI00292E644C|nr:glycosyltransferase [Pedobacter frigidisoli]
MIIHYLWLILQFLIGYNLVLPILLYVIYLLVPSAKESRRVSKDYDYGIIVTAYQQVDLLPAVVQSLLSLNYQHYTIYVVADNCDVSGLSFDDDRVVVLRPEQVLASNTRSHLYAIAHFIREHELITIIDSDNLTDPEYLNEMNVLFERGYEAVQGVRKAKSYDTAIAAMDAARDYYYHFFDGELLFKLGSSATLAGSGMAFKTSLYLDCFKNYDLEGAGFDKVLQAKIVGMNKRIAFVPQAIVYDEKTANSTQLVHQRSRWINTWFKYFGLGLSVLIKGFKTLSWNQILFGTILVRPPLFIFILLSVICFAANILMGSYMAITWFVALLLFVTGFYIGLRHGKADQKIFRSLLNIPAFMYLQVCSLLKIRNANKRSVATVHVIPSLKGEAKS